MSHRFFTDIVVAAFGAVIFSIPSPTLAIASNQNPTIIFSEDFESGNFSKWAECYDQITTQQVRMGTHALHYDGGPGCSGYFSKATREAYLSFWWYFPTGFSTGFAPGRHFWRMTYGTKAHYQIQQIDTQAGGPGNGFDLVFLLNGDGPAYFSAATLPVGRWFKFDFYVRLNDPGVANGETAVWIDGVETFRRTNVYLNADKDLTMLLLTTNYSNCSGTCHWYVDEVKVWNGCPSTVLCSAAQSPLSPPHNLRVVP